MFVDTNVKSLKAHQENKAQYANINQKSPGVAGLQNKECARDDKGGLHLAMKGLIGQEDPPIPNECHGAAELQNA